MTANGSGGGGGGGGGGGRRPREGLYNLSPHQSNLEASYFSNSGKGVGGPEGAGVGLGWAGRAAGTGAGLLCVQGIVLLSRPTALPVSRGDLKRPPPAATRPSSTDVWMDVVVLGPPLSSSGPPSGESRPPPQKPGTGTGTGNDDGAAVTALDVAHWTIDPVEYTGISHRGLAVGPTLAKLMATHTHTHRHSHGSNVYRRRPVFTVELSPLFPAALRRRGSAANPPPLSLPHLSSSNTALSSVKGPSTHPILPTAEDNNETEGAHNLPPETRTASVPAATAAEPKAALPALPPQKLPPGRRTPLMASPLQGRVLPSGGGAAAEAAAAVDATNRDGPGVRHPHFARGTVVSTAPATAAAASTSPVAAAPSPAATHSGNTSGVASNLPGLPTFGHSSATANGHSGKGVPALMKFKAQPQRPSLFLDNGNNNNNNSINNSSIGTGTGNVRCGSNSVNTPVVSGGHAVLPGVRPAAHSSNTLRKEESALPATTPASSSVVESRLRSESTGFAVKRRQQQVQQQREQYQQRRGNSLGSTPSPPASSVTTTRANGSTSLEGESDVRRE